MLTIRDVKVGGSNPCFIIAEVGQNHQGDIGIAKEMIRKAKECGVSCVKFQKSTLSHRFTKGALEALYVSENSFGETYGDHRAHLEFNEDEFKMLQEYAEDTVGIMFTASCMDIPSANFLNTLKVPFMKIGSGDTNNAFLIEHVAKMGLPIIISTGMSNMDTVRSAHNLIKRYTKNFAILHCVSAYPTPPEDVNLAVLQTYKSVFSDVVVGYSGHEQGIAIAIAAVVHGAKIIEKHFTLDKSLKGTDHQCSLDPKEMKNLVDGIRAVEAALGNPTKKILPSEIPCQSKLGKTIVASTSIEQDARIRLSDVAIKVSNPPGLQPQYLDDILGCRVTQKIEADTPITMENIDLSETNSDQ